MGREEDGYPVGNTDPDKRGRNLPRQDRETDDETEAKRREQRGTVGYGEVTEDPNRE